MKEGEGLGEEMKPLFLVTACRVIRYCLHSNDQPYSATTGEITIYKYEIWDYKRSLNAQSD